MRELRCEGTPKDDYEEVDLEKEEIEEAEGKVPEEVEDESEDAFVGEFRVIALGMTEEQVTELIGKFLDEQFDSVELDVNKEE